MTLSRLLFAALLIVARNAWADLPWLIPHHELINSDVVVSGVITRISLYVADNHEYNAATVRVLKVFAGRMIVHEELEIAWENRTGVTCPRASHERLLGKEAIWFLRYTGSPQFDMNDPQRVIPVSRDVLEDFLIYFAKRHGPPDTEIERLVVDYIRTRIAFEADRTGKAH